MDGRAQDPHTEVTCHVSTLVPMSALASRRPPRPGIDRPETPYAWPLSLLTSPAGKPLVYLDMNHWIYLAQAATGHASGRRHREALGDRDQAGGQSK
jgi:hypothetical protein